MFAAEAQAETELERACGLAVLAGDVVHGILQRRKAARDLLQETLARLGQRKLSRVALEQAHAQVSLEAGDVLAHGCGREA